MLSKFFRDYSVIVVLSFFLVMIGAIVSLIFYHQQKLLEESAKETAKQIGLSIKTKLRYYEKAVIVQLKNDQKFSENGSFGFEKPLSSFQFIEGVASQISRDTKNQVIVQFYKTGSFSGNKAEKNYKQIAWQTFLQNPDNPYVFFQDYGGIPSIRYAQLVTVKACVFCPNFELTEDYIQEIIMPLKDFKEDINYAMLIFSIVISISATPIVLVLILSLSRLRVVNTRLVKTNIYYKRFIPDNLFHHLNIKDWNNARLGDNKRLKMLVMFCDIRTFSDISKGMTAEENFLFLNSYYQYIEPIIEKYQGFIDKYVGGNIMSLFEGKADEAIYAAIDILKALDKWNVERKSWGKIPVKIEFGMHSGELILGLVGSETRLDGTVISDAVNLASRVKNATQQYNSSILISDDVYHSLKNPKNFSMRNAGTIQVKGRRKSVTIWEVYDGDLTPIYALKKQTNESFTQALVLFELGAYEEAEQKFLQVLKIYPEDKISALYHHRCQIMGNPHN